MIFHRHKWVEVKRTFNRPVTNVTSVKNVSPEYLNMIIYGFTVIELGCCICGDVRFRETFGAA